MTNRGTLTSEDGHGWLDFKEILGSKNKAARSGEGADSPSDQRVDGTFQKFLLMINCGGLTGVGKEDLAKLPRGGEWKRLDEILPEKRSRL